VIRPSPARESGLVRQATCKLAPGVSQAGFGVRGTTSMARSVGGARFAAGTIAYLRGRGPSSGRTCWAWLVTPQTVLARQKAAPTSGHLLGNDCSTTEPHCGPYGLLDRNFDCPKGVSFQVRIDGSGM